MKKNHPRQDRVLELIKNSIHDKGYPPTIKELCDEMCITSNAVRNHIAALVKKGKVTRTSGARTLRVLI
ncbi:MAG: transcriptional regulator [Patescibacteria group bacterium]|nr:transcriptional regulator [Patescibacteria group bacterium]